MRVHDASPKRSGLDDGISSRPLADREVVRDSFTRGQVVRKNLTAGRPRPKHASAGLLPIFVQVELADHAVELAGQ